MLPMIMAINATQIYVSDLDRALNFFVTTLGFEKRSDIPAGRDSGFVVVAPPGAQSGLVLFKPTLTGMAPQSFYEAHRRIGKFTGVSLQTDDIHATFAELQARGVVFNQEPTAVGWGTMALFEDPDGNTFFLVELA